MRTTNALGAIGTTVALLTGGCAVTPSAKLQTTEHRISVISIAPSIRGQKAELYVRELRPLASGPLPVVVFVHGAGTPGEVSFDPSLPDHSWMKHVTIAGFDTFAMSLTGYGRSTRPAPMNQPCNIVKAQQQGYVAQPCAPDYPYPITTSESDELDIDSVVEHVRQLRGVERVSLVGWSQGGPRIGGYIARHPDKVDRAVVLAPAYSMNIASEVPGTPLALPNGSMIVQSRKDFLANWDRQVDCPEQYDSAAAMAIFDDILASDPVGATWGTGVRRAPVVPIRGFTKELVAQIRTPFLVFAAEQDKQVAPQNVHNFYADLGSEKKVLVDLACASHNALWERNRQALYEATVNWLREGKIHGMDRGIVRLEN